MSTTRMSYGAALESAMFDEMRRDRRVYMMATSVPQMLLDEYGPQRVKRMPISEATMTGIAVGSAGCGFRPVVHWRSVTFAFMAFDQVVNQACKIRYMFGGQRDFPIVFRASYGNGTRSAAHRPGAASTRQPPLCAPMHSKATTPFSSATSHWRSTGRMIRPPMPVRAPVSSASRRPPSKHSMRASTPAPAVHRKALTSITPRSTWSRFERHRALN